LRWEFGLEERRYLHEDTNCIRSLIIFADGLGDGFQRLLEIVEGRVNEIQYESTAECSLFLKTLLSLVYTYDTL
jgi:hypothetical protein